MSRLLGAHLYQAQPSWSATMGGWPWLSPLMLPSHSPPSGATISLHWERMSGAVSHLHDLPAPEQSHTNRHLANVPWTLKCLRSPWGSQPLNYISPRQHGQVTTAHPPVEKTKQRHFIIRYAGLHFPICSAMTQTVSHRSSSRQFTMLSINNPEGFR